MVLADTNVWVTYLRQGRAGRAWHLDSLLASGEVIVCGPVAAELLAGTEAGRRPQLWRLLSGLAWADIGKRQWRRVGEVAATLRAQGRTLVLTDIEIAVAAADTGAELWTNGTGFDRLFPVLPPLRLFQPPV